MTRRRGVPLAALLAALSLSACVEEPTPYQREDRRLNNVGQAAVQAEMAGVDPATFDSLK